MKFNRINEIEKFLIENTSASIPQLCERFEVSSNTIRRDIAELCSRGIAKKVYGGIAINAGDDVVHYQTRSVSHLEEKVMLAQLASRYIENGETIYIDSGTTTVNLLRFIPENINLTIISNSLNVYSEAARLPHLNVIATGGLMDHKTNSFIGMTTINTIRSYHISKAFMAATGVSLKIGATNNSFHEAEVKKFVTGQCKSIILMADHTKIDRRASIAFCPMGALSAFVTDQRPPRPYLDFFAENGIDCLYTDM